MQTLPPDVSDCGDRQTNNPWVSCKIHSFVRVNNSCYNLSQTMDQLAGIKKEPVGVIPVVVFFLLVRSMVLAMNKKKERSGDRQNSFSQLHCACWQCLTDIISGKGLRQCLFFANFFSFRGNWPGETEDLRTGRSRLSPM